ncbi:hypothetical protein [Aquimonas voraii]|uniref:hypothetical protein n=1 Tax=Aquimonas voraii TaxID=265719 RepID=UPI00115F855D|nr:hypothetical protein [Aquimonas voraii]
MTPESFVAGLVEIVHEASVSDTLEMLHAGPSGRRPPRRLAELSEWYQGLPSADQTRVREVLELAVHSTLFGTLCVLDGSRMLDPSTKFEVFAVHDGSRQQLNAPELECLHDEYQNQVYERVFGAGA